MARRFIKSLALATAIFGFSFSQAYAFSCTTNGTGGGDFNLASTWTACNGTTPQTTDSITITTGDTVTLVATTTVAGITINNGGVLAANTRTLTDTAGYTNNGSHTGTTSTLRLTGPAGQVIDGNGSYEPTSVVTISIGDKTVAAGSQLTFNRITVTGVTLTNNSTAGLTVSTALVGTGQLTQGPGGVLNLGGTSTITVLDAAAVPNEVHYTSTTANQTIKSPASAYHHLFIEKVGRVATLGGATTVNGDLEVIGGTLADGGFQITGNALGTFSLAAETTLTLGAAASPTGFPTGFVTSSITLAPTSTVSYTSSVAQTISNVTEYGNLSTTAASPVTKTIAGPITVNGVLNNGTNNTLADDGFTITLKDGCTMTGAHTGTGKILFTGGSAAHAVAGAGSFGNVELDDSQGVTQSGIKNIAGTFTITTGTWNVGAFTIAVTGDTHVADTLLISSTTGTKTFGNLTIANTGVVQFTATEAMTVNGDLTINGSGVISGTSGVWTLQKVGGGTLGGSASTLTVLGALSFVTPYTITMPLTVNTYTVNTGVTQTNTEGLTIQTSLTGAGTLAQAAGSVLNLNGTSPITTLDASATGNEVHYTSTTANQTLKTATYFHLFLEKTGRVGTVSGATTVLGNVTVTAGTLTLGASTLVVEGSTDVHGTLRDVTDVGSAHFKGLVTVHASGSWDGSLAESCSFDFSNGFDFQGTDFVTGGGIYTFKDNNQTLTSQGAISLANLVVTGIQLSHSGSSPLSIRSSLSGTGSFVQAAGSTLELAGTNTITTFDASALGNTVRYTGTSAQLLKDATYDTLDVSANTAQSVTLGANTSVQTSLALGDTKLTTLTNLLILGAPATWSRTDGYVVGVLRKLFQSDTSFTFPVGDEFNYTPVELALHGVQNSSSIDASVVPADEPDTINGVSGLDKDKSVNRFWIINNNGLTFDTYDLVLHFTNNDLDPEVEPSNLVVAKKSGNSWSLLPAILGVSATTVVGQKSLSTFQIGIKRPDPPALSTTDAEAVVATIRDTVKTVKTTIIESLPTPELPALFDVLSAPVHLGQQLAVRWPIIVVAFLGGSLGGVILVGIQAWQRKSQVLRSIQKQLRHL